MATAVGGTVATQVLEGKRSFDLAVKLRPESIANLEEMRAIPLFGSNNEIISLGQVGFLPAALSHAVGAETARPFAVVIVGGLTSVTPFTLCCRSQ